MVIIEGPDGAGKTTLAKYLATIFSLPIKGKAAVVEPTSHPAKRLLTALGTDLTTISLGAQPHVYDRLFFSEEVYGSVIRDKSRFHPDHRDLFKHFVTHTRSPTIFCLPPFPVVKENVEASPQMEGVVEHIKEIYDRYVVTAITLNGTSCPTYLYDYTQDGTEQVITAVADHIDHRKELFTW